MPNKTDPLPKSSINVLSSKKYVKLGLRTTALWRNVMAGPYFRALTLDDMMRSVFMELLSSGDRIHPTKGPATELAGVLLEITSPRARLSRTETRGKPFSCLGELCWYLAGTNKLEFIVIVQGVEVFRSRRHRVAGHGKSGSQRPPARGR